MVGRGSMVVLGIGYSDTNVPPPSRRRRHEENAGRDTSRGEIFEAFVLDGVSVRLENGKVVAELGFQMAEDPDHYVTVYLEDWKDGGSSIDS